jgi:hypothetical protein
MQIGLREQVGEWLNRRPGECYCDDCITEELHDVRLKNVQRITRALGHGYDPDFNKYAGRCDQCGKVTLVTIAILHTHWPI